MSGQRSSNPFGDAPDSLFGSRGQRIVRCSSDLLRGVDIIHRRQKVTQFHAESLCCDIDLIKKYPVTASLDVAYAGARDTKFNGKVVLLLIARATCGLESVANSTLNAFAHTCVQSVLMSSHGEFPIAGRLGMSSATHISAQHFAQSRVRTA